jgi:N-acetylglucosaminyldiphosphoundecaprenol N-acetyl-beta-D-mannosaminyltransferase
MPGRMNILGVGVNLINMTAALNEIERWIASREPHYVCVTGVHGVMESWRDPGLRSIHNRAGLVTPDGMPLVWLGRLKGSSHVERVGPDLMLAMCDRSIAFGYRHFLYGGTEKTLEALQTNLRRRFVGLNVVGAMAPPFRALTPEEDKQIVARIRSAAPDIVWVGLSTPKQERWMAEHVGELEVPVLVGVGAAFDFHAGIKRQAPLWMRSNGLEWFFRLVTEPRRLWHRYLVNNPMFIYLLLLQATGRISMEL